MKKPFLTLLITAAALSLTAQEVVPLEKAQKAARLIANGVASLESPPFKAEWDSEAPQIITKGDLGICVLPVKDLNEAGLTPAGKGTNPLGLLCLRGLMPAPGGLVPLEHGEVREITLSDGGKSATLRVFHLGVRTGKGDQPELVLFARVAEPVLRVALTKRKSRQEFPLELAVAGADGGATLTVSVLGNYQAEIPIVQAESSTPAAPSNPGGSDKIARAAGILRAHLNSIKDAPFKVRADWDAADLFEHSGTGAFVVPQKGLPDELAKLSDRETPLGQLWLKDLLPLVSGSADAISYAEVEADGREARLGQFLIAARMGKDGSSELVVYSLGARPLLTLPLQASRGTQSRPIVLDGRGNDDGTGTLSIRVLGKYVAEMQVAPRR